MDCPFSDDLLFSRTLNTVWRWIVGRRDGWSFMKMVKSSTRRNRNMDLTTAPSLQWDAFWLIGWINYNHWHHRCNMIKGTTFQVSSPFGSIVYTYLIFDTTFRTGGGVLFQIGVLFFAKRMWMMAYFSPFRPRLVTLLQVPALLVVFFYRFKKCGGVPKLTNIRYELLSFSKKLWFAKYFLWQHWLNLFCHPASHFEPGGGWNCPCLKTCQNKSGSTRTKCEKDCNCWNVIVIPQNFA